MQVVPVIWCHWVRVEDIGAVCCAQGVEYLLYQGTAGLGVHPLLGSAVERHDEVRAERLDHPDVGGHRLAKRQRPTDEGVQRIALQTCYSRLWRHGLNAYLLGAIRRVVWHFMAGLGRGQNATKHDKQ